MQKLTKNKKKLGGFTLRSSLLFTYMILSSFHPVTQLKVCQVSIHRVDLPVSGRFKNMDTPNISHLMRLHIISSILINLKKCIIIPIKMILLFKFVSKKENLNQYIIIFFFKLKF